MTPSIILSPSLASARVSSFIDWLTVSSESKAVRRRRDRANSHAYSETSRSPKKLGAELNSDKGNKAGAESLKESRPRIDAPLPWGIVERLSRAKQVVGYEASFRLPKDLLRARTVSIRSRGRGFAVVADRKVRLGRVDTVEEAISMQHQFMDGLEDQDLAQELRR